MKGLGQNYLVDDNLAAKLAAAALEPGPERVIEIGPGLGALTLPLLQSGVPVIAFEKDRKLEAPLRALLGGFPGFDLRMGDFLDADLTDLAGPGTVAVGNLPYYVTTPILIRLLELRPALGAIVVTMQREVADRLTARPDTREYGSLTLLVWYHVERIEPVARLGPSVFLPPPAVSSAALRLIPRREPPAEVADPGCFFAVTRAAFGYRRKTLARALVSALDLALDLARATEVLELAGIDPGRRGETLSPQEFAALANALARRVGRA